MTQSEPQPQLRVFDDSEISSAVEVLTRASLLVAEIKELREREARIRALLEQTRPVTWQTGIMGRAVSDVELLWALEGTPS